MESMKWSSEVDDCVGTGRDLCAGIAIGDYKQKMICFCTITYNTQLLYVIRA